MMAENLIQQLRINAARLEANTKALNRHTAALEAHTEALEAYTAALDAATDQDWRDSESLPIPPAIQNMGTWSGILPGDPDEGFRPTHDGGDMR